MLNTNGMDSICKESVSSTINKNLGKGGKGKALLTDWRIVRKTSDYVCTALPPLLHTAVNSIRLLPDCLTKSYEHI